MAQTIAEADQTEASLRPIILATLALGATMLAALGLTGDLWPTAGEEQRASLHRMMSILFFAFQAVVIVLALAYTFYVRLKPLRTLINLYGVVVFAVGISLGVIEFDHLMTIASGRPESEVFILPGLEPVALLQVAVVVLIAGWVLGGMVRDALAALRKRQNPHA